MSLVSKRYFECPVLLVTCCEHGSLRFENVTFQEQASWNECPFCVNNIQALRKLVDYRWRIKDSKTGQQWNICHINKYEDAEASLAHAKISKPQGAWYIVPVKL